MPTCLRTYSPRPNPLDGIPVGCRYVGLHAAFRRFDHGRVAGPWQWGIFDKVKYRLTA